MPKEVVCVYQDCALCGDKGKTVVKIATAKGANIRKVSFVTDEGRELIIKALFEHGIGTMPFYVMDGKFSTDVSKLLTVETVKTKRAVNTKKTDVKTRKSSQKAVKKGNKRLKEANELDH